MLLDTKASGVVVCSARSENCAYWRNWSRGLAKQFDRPASCFQGHKAKLRDGVMVLFFFQPEWIDKFEYIKLKEQERVPRALWSVQEPEWHDEELEQLVARLYLHNNTSTEIANKLHIWNVTVLRILREFFILKPGPRNGRVVYNPNNRRQIEY